MGNNVSSNFLASSRSVGTAVTMAGAGIYLHRLGLTNDDGKKLLAKISQKVTIPALLFTKIVYCKQDSSQDKCTSIFDMLDSVWMILFWPLYVVGCGLIVGKFVIRMTNTPMYHRPLVLACCAFANSTGLPITLLSVIHQNFSPSTELGRIDATLFLSIYLLLYPVLQWGIGGWLLMEDDSDNDGKISEEGMKRIDDGVLEDNSKDSISLVKEENETACDATAGVSVSYSQSSSSALGNVEPNYFENSRLIDNYHEERIIDYSNYADYTNAIEQKQQQSTTEEEENDEDSQSLLLWSKLRNGFDKAMQPPVIGALSGLLVAAIHPLRAILVDIDDRNDDALLEFIFDGIYSIGQAAVPINMIILGINLSRSAQMRSSSDTDSLSMQTILGVIVAKMIIMPIIGIASVLFLKRHILNIPDEIDDAFYLVLMMVFITPTANNVMIMVELGEKVSKEGISRLIGWQYLFAPVLLSINVSIIIYLVNNNGDATM